MLTFPTPLKCVMAPRSTNVAAWLTFRHGCFLDNPFPSIVSSWMYLPRDTLKPIWSNLLAGRTLL